MKMDIDIISKGGENTTKDTKTMEEKIGVFCFSHNPKTLSLRRRRGMNQCCILCVSFAGALTRCQQELESGLLDQRRLKRGVRGILLHWRKHMKRRLHHCERSETLACIEEFAGALQPRSAPDADPTEVEGANVVERFITICSLM